MPFQDTGLPNDPMIRNAYSIFERQLPTIEDPRHRHYLTACLETAKVLAEYAPEAKMPIAMMLVSGSPPEAVPALKKRFGEDMTKLMDEVLRHNQTGLAHIAEGSNDAKLITLAARIHGLHGFLKLVHEQEAKRLSTEFNMQTSLNEEPSAPERIGVPYMSNLPEHKSLLATLQGKTSSPALEAAYEEALTLAEETNTRQMETLDKMGISRELGANIQQLSFPRFEESTLLDHPTVRAAYEILTHDQRVNPDSFTIAIETAEILSRVSDTKNPATIAAALVGIGVPDATKKDFEAWEESIGTETTDTLMEGTVYRRETMMNLARKSTRVKQVFAAFFAFNLYSYEMAATQLENMPQGQMRQINAIMLSQQVAGMKHLAQAVLDGTDDPSLERLLRENMMHAQQKIATLLPKNGHMPGGTNPPFPGTGR